MPDHSDTRCEKWLPSDALGRETEWSRDRLVSLLKERLSGIRVVVVANREPYIHNRVGPVGGELSWIRPASGLVTALDPIMRATGGVWIAHGSGSGDHETADERGRLAVPPQQAVLHAATRLADPGRGTGLLLRLLEPRAVAALPHRVHAAGFRRVPTGSSTRASTRSSPKPCSKRSTARRPSCSCRTTTLRCCRRIVKRKRPDAVISHFWHIPWPHREAFRICPWQEEILDGLLGSDLLGFHVQLHCNNFLETVDRLVESRVDYERFSVTRGSHETKVRPFPISIDMEGISQNGAARSDVQAFRKSLGLRDEWALAIGVDRMDYTKGIPERLRAVDRFLERYPVWRNRFVFLQMGAPSRTEIIEYKDLNDEVDELAAHDQRQARRRTTGSRSSLRARTTASKTSSPAIAPPTCASSRRCTTA